jgi:hypothetical protein
LVVLDQGPDANASEDDQVGAQNPWQVVEPWVLPDRGLESGVQASGERAGGREDKEDVPLAVEDCAI